MSTPASTTPSQGGLLGYTSTTLEIFRKDKRYSVLLRINTGNAYMRLTPESDIRIHDWFDDVITIHSANLEWYGDFDGDGEVEYLLTAYSRGSYLSIGVLAVDYDMKNDEYRVFDEKTFGSACFDEWKNIEEDGIPEILVKDEDFHNISRGGGMDSVFSPIMILRYSGKIFEKVTHKYPDLVETDAHHWLSAIDNDAWGQGQFPSIYSSYLADMYLLGKKDEGIRIFTEQCKMHLQPIFDASYATPKENCESFLLFVEDALMSSGY